MVGYDTFGEQVETSDPNGNVVTTGYDADGRAVSVTSPSYTPPGGTPITAVSHKTYTSTSQVATATDPLGNRSSYVYDQLGRLAKVTAPNTGVTHRTYDTEGDQLSVTDPNGAVQQATYDYLGRKATTTQAVRQPTTNSYTTTYAYNTPGGWLSTATTPGNVVTTYDYDNMGEVMDATDNIGNTTSYDYDYVGRRYYTRLPDGTVTTLSFDPAGRQTGATKSDTNGTTILSSTSAGYDNDGNQTSITDARGHTSTFSYDALGRLTGESQPTSSSTSIATSFGYDAAGRRTRFTDGRGNPFITTYNTWGLPESTIEPSTPAYPNAPDRTFVTSYDADGRVGSQTSPGNVVVTNTYNTIGNLTGQSGTGADAATTARTFGYDTAGRLTSAAAPGGTDTFTLDDRGLLLSTAGPSGTSSFAYNGDALMTSRTDASGTSSYTYDTVDRLKTVTDASTSAVLTYSYNNVSQPSGIAYGAGADTRSYGYDHLHRLTSDTLKTNAGSTIASITYGYDANDNETSKATVGFSGASSNTYTYDWADRLLSWNNGTATSNYAYDNSGNRTQSGTQTFAYNARNQLTTGGGSTYNYTARGTLASVVTGGTTVTTTNDAFGQASTQGTQTYTYDAVGRVVTDATSGGGTRTFAYTGAANELASDGTSTYSRGPAGGLDAVKTGASGVLAWTDLHTDLVGQFTATGTSLAGSATYGPLGTSVSSSGMTGGLGYQSAFTESSNGRVNMAARWYNPTTGQFDSRDTVANNPTPNSANANGYVYATDNPLTGTDPTGHMKQPIEGGSPPPPPVGNCNAPPSQRSANCPPLPDHTPKSPSPPSFGNCNAPPNQRSASCPSHVNDGRATPPPAAPPVPAPPPSYDDADGQAGPEERPAITKFPYGTVLIVFPDGTAMLNGVVLPPGSDPYQLAKRLDDDARNVGLEDYRDDAGSRFASSWGMIEKDCTGICSDDFVRQIGLTHLKLVQERAKNVIGACFSTTWVQADSQPHQLSTTTSIRGWQGCVHFAGHNMAVSVSHLDIKASTTIVGVSLTFQGMPYGEFHDFCGPFNFVGGYGGPFTGDGAWSDDHHGHVTFVNSDGFGAGYGLPGGGAYGTSTTTYMHVIGSNGNLCS
ncbi:MAG: hypothetical protein AUI14_07560 [Actinobacteria bacterium 13_2_20CM_2_71_6]|nr:MAG: hypothetical protein AUI14_07560 [Actinobacteria bacterium 13_2_20CM_2_71_6]